MKCLLELQTLWRLFTWRHVRHIGEFFAEVIV